MNDDIDRELPMEIGDALRDREETVAVAESCTGGLIGAAITSIPGASDHFDSGLTTYAYNAKRRHLGVSREALDEHGAVSEPVAREMARGVRDVADVTWGVSTTGVAGPTGGTEANPVGTVYIGVAYAGPWGSESSFASVSRYVFDGDRAAVRAKTVERALEDLLAAIGETER
ncbi:nicotinamide-nucleotide amidohydrolase family protein [Natronorubrum sp. JWXQ-INN-674]|uniref:Nicotinamide-nucleotide amidohydrolase family protein n=1 Tax=Natronorubrum halalkaliphilum TaxID=2691917 RepID=A0A6B0VHZ9_9EURY|nr:CinA family protein [Natronorubrum halalkaliphilum]MXV60685.1 nicotinamide-nucleotide amidohydrolase family protein [Natronorubrum halalkaliphilum]